MSKEYSFLPCYQSGDILRGSDMASYILVLQYVQEHSLTLSDEEYLHGFNSSSGFVYVTTEDDIQVCSAFGQDVTILITDSDSGEETFFDTYQEALDHKNGTDSENAE